MFCHILFFIFTSICAAIGVDNNCLSSSESTSSLSLESELSKPDSLLLEEVPDETDRTLSLSADGLSDDCDPVPQWVALHFSPPRFSSLPSLLAVRAPLLLLPARVESSPPDFALPVLRIQLQLPRCLLSWPSDAFRQMGHSSKIHYVHTSIFECNYYKAVYTVCKTLKGISI